MGYYRAGFHDITGVDVAYQKRYPFRFVQADALEYVQEHGHEYDVIHASPPCQKWTVAQNAARNADSHSDLIAPLRPILQELGKPYVIENVVGAPLVEPVKLCGISFGLKVRRHRLFECSFFVPTMPCQCQNADYYVIFGHEIRNRRKGNKAGRKNSIAEGRKAMDIDWMTRAELTEAIPPAYTEFIAYYLLEHILQPEAA